MAKSQITPKEIREARAFLQRRNLGTADVSPKSFAAMAKRLGQSFAETLKQIAYLKTRGTGLFEETKEALRTAGTK